MSSAESSPTANTVDRSISAGAPERAPLRADAREACACSGHLTGVNEASGESPHAPVAVLHGRSASSSALLSEGLPESPQDTAPPPAIPASASSPNDGTPSIRNTALSTPTAEAASAARSVHTASTSKPTNSTSGRSFAHATVYSPLPQPKSSTTCENAFPRTVPPGAHASQRPAHAAPSQQIQSLHP